MAKKAIALLLALLMLGCACGAQADTCFLALFSMLYGEEILGQPAYFTPMETEEEENPCTLFFDYPNTVIALSGEDNEDAPYTLVWVTDANMMFNVMEAVCLHYGDLQPLSAHGLYIAWKLEEGDDPSVIADAESAQLLAAAIETMFAGAASRESAATDEASAESVSAEAASPGSASSQSTVTEGEATP